MDYNYSVIDKIVNPGVNKIELNVGPVKHGCPAILDPLRLVGKFRVTRTQDCISDTKPDCRPDWYKNMLDDDTKIAKISSCPKMITIAQPSDWTKLGFSQYSGLMSYRASFNILSLPETCYMEVSFEQQDPFELCINGKSAGICCWCPFRLEVSKLLKLGSNDVEFKVTNTLINKNEGKAQPSGLLALPLVCLV